MKINPAPPSKCTSACFSLSNPRLFGYFMLFSGCTHLEYILKKLLFLLFSLAVDAVSSGPSCFHKSATISPPEFLGQVFGFFFSFFFTAILQCARFL